MQARLVRVMSFDCQAIMNGVARWELGLMKILEKAQNKNRRMITKKVSPWGHDRIPPKNFGTFTATKRRNRPMGKSLLTPPIMMASPGLLR